MTTSRTTGRGAHTLATLAFAWGVLGAAAAPHGISAGTVGNGWQDGTDPAEGIYSEADEVLERGLAMAESGDWEEALEYWVEARHELADEGLFDPRIAVNFVDLATFNASREHYEDATRMVLWGFSGYGLGLGREAVLGEVRRIIPLLEEADSARWTRLLAEESPELPLLIKRFWIEKDRPPPRS